MKNQLLEELLEELKKNIIAGAGLTVGVGSKHCKARKPGMDGKPECVGCISEEGCKLYYECVLVLSKGLLYGANPAYIVLNTMALIKKQQDKMELSPLAKKLNSMLQESR